MPSRPGRTAATSTSTGWQSLSGRRPGSTHRTPPPRSPHPSNDRSPHQVLRRRNATTRSTPTAYPPTPAEYAQSPPPAHRPAAHHAAKNPPAQQNQAPTRPPPQQTPAHRPTTADPSPPTANPDPNTRTPCPCRAVRRAEQQL